jgi:pimeloyl-ACP methyl ester carboxylesterase
LNASASDRPGQLDGPAGRFSWHELGDGPPLILINGYASTGADWPPAFLAALAEKRRLICPDNRGVGSSDLGDEPLSFDVLAQDVSRLLEHLDLDAAPVAGWSMGGYVAQTLAATLPERVESLILLSTAPKGDVAVASEPGTWDRLIDHSGSPREQARRWIELLYPPDSAEEAVREFGAAVEETKAALHPETLEQQEAMISGWHGAKPDGEGFLAMPLLVMAGAEDIVIPPANAAILATLSSRPWTAVFDGGGHAFMGSRPERVAALIGAFLGD